jgi:hypothetical protein
VGKSGDVKRTVEMIIQKSGASSVMKLWKEFNIEPASEPVFITPSGGAGI